VIRANQLLGLRGGPKLGAMAEFERSERRSQREQAQEKFPSGNLLLRSPTLGTERSEVGIWNLESRIWKRESLNKKPSLFRHKLKTPLSSCKRSFN